MNKTIRNWLITAAALLLVGLGIFATVMTAHHWDFTKLNENAYTTNTYEISDEFHDISIKSDTMDITFALSENGIGKAVCVEKENNQTTISVQNGTLVINTMENNKWYDYIMNFGSSSIVVYLPHNEYRSLQIQSDTSDIKIAAEFHFQQIDISVSTGDVDCYASAADTIKIKASTGNVNVQQVNSETVEITTSTGNITATSIQCIKMHTKVSTGKTILTKVTCSELTTTGNTGDITLTDVIVLDTMSITRTTGDVKFNGCDAGEILVRTDTGDVVGTLLSEKIFITKTNTGEVKVPNSVTGQRCEITTDTGDIKIEILP